MKRIITIIFLSSILTIGIIMPIGKYIHAKTFGKGVSDCMLTYVNTYFPHGSTYEIEGMQHIDKRNIENEYIKKTGDVYRCSFTGQTHVVRIVNTPYCHWTLFLEKQAFSPLYY